MYKPAACTICVAGHDVMHLHHLHHARSWLGVRSSWPHNRRCSDLVALAVHSDH
jgi:hypothetical protein